MDLNKASMKMSIRNVLKSELVCAWFWKGQTWVSFLASAGIINKTLKTKQKIKCRLLFKAVWDLRMSMCAYVYFEFLTVKKRRRPCWLKPTGTKVGCHLGNKTLKQFHALKGHFQAPALSSEVFHVETPDYCLASDPEKVHFEWRKM